MNLLVHQKRNYIFSQIRLIAIFLTFSNLVFSQAVGIGETSIEPDSNAILEVSSTLSIYNAFGKLVKLEKVASINATFTREIDIAGYLSGIDFIKLESGESVNIARIHLLI